jgi:DNA processing protein
VARFVAKRRTFSAIEIMKRTRDSGLDFVPYGCPLYPMRLTHLSHPPAGLFIRGEDTAMARFGQCMSVSVVGTRKATPYGRRAAEALALAFAERGIAVVSGMAFGIDACAHEAALDAGGLTVAVLGCGADVMYPLQHRGLYERLAREGLVMSELPPGCPPARWTFPHRNRILAALADAVLVVEGSRVSGAMQTAGWALDLGRWVYAVPGPIMTANHEGCNLLLYEGATPALDPELTVEDFFLRAGMERGERVASGESVVKRTRGGSFGGDGPESVDAGSVAIVRILSEGPCSVDELATRTGLSAREITVSLTRLELTRLIRRAGPGMFARGP